MLREPMDEIALARTFRALWWRATHSMQLGERREDALRGSYWMARVAQLGLSRIVRDEWTADTGRTSLRRALRVALREMSSW